jgi:hypothetical protein
MIGTNGELLRQMKTRIEGIEDLVRELKTLGEGIPVVEKNARCILGFTHALRFGISDVAEVNTEGGEESWEK